MMLSIYSLISLLNKAFINGTDTKVFVSGSAENKLSSVQDPEFCAAPYIGVFFIVHSPDKKENLCSAPHPQVSYSSLYSILVAERYWSEDCFLFTRAEA
jgi:hypothetical protein